MSGSRPIRWSVPDGAGRGCAGVDGNRRRSMRFVSRTDDRSDVDDRRLRDRGPRTGVLHSDRDRHTEGVRRVGTGPRRGHRPDRPRQDDGPLGHGHPRHADRGQPIRTPDRTARSARMPTLDGHRPHQRHDGPGGGFRARCASAGHLSSTPARTGSRPTSSRRRWAAYRVRRATLRRRCRRACPGVDHRLWRPAPTMPSSWVGGWRCLRPASESRCPGRGRGGSGQGWSSFYRDQRSESRCTGSAAPVAASPGRYHVRPWNYGWTAGRRW